MRTSEKIINKSAITKIETGLFKNVSLIIEKVGEGGSFAFSKNVD